MENLQTQNQEEEQRVTMGVKEAAKYLGIGINKMYELVHSQDFTAALRIGKRILISREALDEWIKRKAEQPINDYL